MSEKKRLDEVFSVVGLPKYTYVKPSHFGEVRVDVLQAGKHLLIEGPSGTGKTCVAYKVFEELGWSANHDYRYLSCRDEGAQEAVEEFMRHALSDTPPSPPVLVVDDFHLLPTDVRASLGGQLKRLSDRAFEEELPPKVVLIGIPTSGTSLLSEAYDLGPRLGLYRVSKASDKEIAQLIEEGEQSLNVILEDREILLNESAGNFWLAQYVCQKVCAMNDVHETKEDVEILSFDMLGIRQRIMSELSQRYMPVARTFAKGKKWRPGGNKPYLEVLLALARLPESVVTFDRILNMTVETRRPGLKAIRGRIPEVIRDQTRGVDLRKQLAFEPDSGFSIEDPLFRYFLSNMDINELYRELGIEPDAVDKLNSYSYDVGFSFAGESRVLVEAVNVELKAEDVITFYDFDQQAVLLALDLEQVLTKIYRESCRYYLVFLSKEYNDKVWTRYEKDIMTKSERKDHIIPVVLDDVGDQGVVGISSSVGKIDLRSQWKEVQKTQTVSQDVVNVIRNRCVLPILEKIGMTDLSI